MKFNHLQKKHKYLKENEDTDYSIEHKNDLFDRSIIKNRPFLDRPGKIKFAKKHASADRPLHKLKNFTKETDFCQCCNLPCETKDIIEPFKICDSTDNFSQCGLGISLYFYFFRFMILCLSLVFIILGLPLIYFNNYYSNELSLVCNSNKYNENFTLCEKHIDYNQYSNNTFFISIPFSIDNIYSYLDFSVKTTGTDKNVLKTIICYGILNFYCILILFIINFYFLILVKQKIRMEKSNILSPSDYTLFISNLNNSLYYYEDYCISKKKIIYDDREKFKDFVNFLKNKILYTRKKSGDIYDINFCYKLKDFMISANNVQTINYQLLQIVNNKKQKEKNMKLGLYGEKRKYFEVILGCFCSKGISIKKLLKNREINQRKLNYLLKSSKALTINNFTGSIFLTFNTIQQKEEYYNLYPHYILETIILFFKESKYYFCRCFINEKSKKKFFRRKNIKVYTAPEPEDVIWENIEYDKWFRFRRGFLIYFISFCLLLISFVIILSLTFLKDYLIKHQIKSYFIIKYGVSLLITGVINGLNQIFYLLLDELTKKEMQISMTNYYLSFSVKLTLFTFTTSGIIPLVSNCFENGLKHNEFLVDNYLIIFLCNSFFTPLLWTFDIKYIYNRIKIFLLEKKKDPDKHHNMTQRELNNLYQLANMKIAYKYSYVARTTLLTLFCISIFPFGIIISIIGFGFGYILELFNFTHIYSKPEMINEKICLFYMEYFTIYISVFVLGELIFSESIFTSEIWVVINLIIFLVLSILPYTKLLDFNCLKLKSKYINNTNIEDVYFSFYNDYQRQNPITKIDGLKNYINKLRINGYISQKVYNFSYMNIDTINVMELYYRSKMNRNIVQSQQALANRSTIKNKKMKPDVITGSTNKDKKGILSGSSIYDEQLTNLLKQSIYHQRFGSNLDDLNKILNNKDIFNSNNTELLLDKNKINSEEESKSERSDTIEKNKDYILRQYNYPLLLNISNNIGIGDLGILSEKQKEKINSLTPLHGIKESLELNENDSERKEINRNKDYYGVDYDIYSNKESPSTSFNQNKEKQKDSILIEMTDLSDGNNKNKYQNRYNYEMSDINGKEETLKKKEKKNKNNKNNKNNSDDSNNTLKEYFLNLTKNNYDGDNDDDEDD